MYRTYSADDWRKHLGLDPDYNICGFLSFGTYQKALYQMVKDSLETIGTNPNYNSFSDEFLEPIMEFSINGKNYWFTIAYGGALLSEYAHIASLLGSKKNIFMGTCSGLQSDASSLDFIIPTVSYAEESSAKGYCPSAHNEYAPNDSLSDVLALEISKHHTVHRGPTLTYQAMLSETKDDISQWSAAGYLGVEMEAATVFAVSQHFNVPSAAVLRIGDNLIGPDSLNKLGYAKARELRHKVSAEALSIVLSELIR